MSAVSPSQQPTVLFSIYQKNTLTIWRLVDEMIDPVIKHIILKIVRFMISYLLRSNNSCRCAIPWSSKWCSISLDWLALHVFYQLSTEWRVGASPEEPFNCTDTNIKYSEIHRSSITAWIYCGLASHCPSSCIIHEGLMSKGLFSLPFFMGILHLVQMRPKEIRRSYA